MEIDIQDLLAYIENQITNDQSCLFLCDNENEKIYYNAKIVVWINLKELFKEMLKNK